MITVDGLGKRYRIHHQAKGATTLREVLAAKLRAPFARPDPEAVEDFWALRDVSFAVGRGTVLGIIGRNGAGKSTLLKVLSRITEPTTGRLALDGRVASLLEVGTGFHPELTGRENVFLNGAILGMSRAEIIRKFDEIVAFAEVEQFLDTPVKRYSSGMYMRLAFAVAAHLESEILVIDEVLAVGDAAFQQRCLGKMGEVAGSGRTVLFVSHNLNAVESLCTSALSLEGGRVSEHGSDVRAIVSRYLARSTDHRGGAAEWVNDRQAYNHPEVQPLYFAITDQAGRPLSGPVPNDQPLSVVIRAEIRQPGSSLQAGFSLYAQDSRELLRSLTTDGPQAAWPTVERGLVEFRCALPRRLLNEGTYRLELIVCLFGREWVVESGHNSPALQFEIRGGLSDSPYWLRARPGLFAPEWAWQCAPAPPRSS